MKRNIKNILVRGKLETAMNVACQGEFTKTGKGQKDLKI